MYNIILDVFQEQEETAYKRSFGFRKFRSPGWANKTTHLAFWNRKTMGPPKYCLSLDIAKCYDTIDHKFILEKFGIVELDDKTEPIITISKPILLSWLCPMSQNVGLSISMEL